MDGEQLKIKELKEGGRNFKSRLRKHTLTNEQLRMKRLSFTSTNRCVTAICLYLTSLQTFCSSTIGFKSLFKFSFNTEAKGRGAALTGYASPNTIYTFFLFPIKCRVTCALPPLSSQLRHRRWYSISDNPSRPSPRYRTLSSVPYRKDGQKSSCRLQ